MKNPPAPNKKITSIRYREALAATGPLLIVISSAALPWLFLANGNPARWHDFLNIFLGLVIEALPFLLTGALVAAALGGWHHKKAGSGGFWLRTARNRAGAALTGVGLGFALPVCECGTAPIARQITRQGGPVTLCLVFMLAAPVVNPVTLFTTWLAFGDGLMVAGRAGLTLAVAVSIGLFFSLHPRPASLFQPGLLQLPAASSVPATGHQHPGDGDSGDECCATPHTGLKSSKITLFLNNSLLELVQAARVALPGLALAAAFQAYVTPRFLLGVGHGVVLSVAALMVLAALMSVCSSVDAFVALAFAGIFPPGAVLAFLVFGPLINLKSLLLMRLVLRPRTILLIALMCFELILLAGAIVNSQV